ncbi:2-dehydropantoate 2-reductase [Alteromonas sp. D210916BOD_24]|uniref:2-dehydropantoate 2-reductase n=1 Tax=Alteromonas sp. D210916BOD_24 TaxID=3157618 RepID=UPI00399D379F
MTKIAVLGAGSIGCFVAGCMLSVMRQGDSTVQITLIGRERLQHDIQTNGITVTDFKGRSQHIAHELIQYRTDHHSLTDADFILLCVKSQDTAHAAAVIKQFANPTATIVSLQNGVSNAQTLSQLLTQPVIKGMVPFNVFYQGKGHFHCGTEGDIAIEDPNGRCQPLVHLLSKASLPVSIYQDLTGVQYAKLIMNLNNAVNALSGLPLKAQLGNRQYRLVMAKVLSEALAVFSAAGIKPVRTGKVIPKLMPIIMLLPNFLFNIVAASTLKIDPQARSSMYEDLMLGRRTEIDFLNGEIVRLGKQYHVKTPVNNHLVSLVKAAEAENRGGPNLAANQLLP